MINRIDQANWIVHWRMTESAGLVVYLVDYRGHRVLWEGALPYVTIDHQKEVEVEADAGPTHGPFWVPLGLRTQVGDVRTSPFRGGFELAVDYSAGPYTYTQLWRFHQDGRLAPLLTIHGAGIHDAHTYHPHWRFDFDVDGARHDAVERFEDGRWMRISEEGWFPFTGDADADGSAWRQVDFSSGGGIAIRPHQWEDAELFAIRYHDDELQPTSPQRVGSQAFPAAYVGNEALDNHDVTLWYVAHVHYDTAFPFTAGPWLRVDGLV